MIIYNVTKTVVLFNRVALKLQNFRTAAWVAVIPAIICGTINIVLGWIDNDFIADFFKVDSNVYAAVTSLLSFLLAFRTSVAYSRFWEGCEVIESLLCSWCSTASVLCAFCSFSNASEDLIIAFKQKLIRLLSLMNALMIAQMEKESDGFPSKHKIIDPSAFDLDFWKNLRAHEHKPQVVFQWTQMLIVQAIKDGVLSIPPPLIGAAFGTLNKGLGDFYHGVKLECLPCPYPYVAMVEMLLIMHTIFTPIVLAKLIENTVPASAFVWLIEFFMWSTYLVSKELECPFGQGLNNLNSCALQDTLNDDLVTTVKCSTNHLPELTVDPQEAERRSEGSNILDTRTHPPSKLEVIAGVEGKTQPVPKLPDATKIV